MSYIRPVNMKDLQNIIATINQQTPWPVDATAISRISGGCIHSAYIIGKGEQRAFIKVGAASALDQFKAEAFGLKTMQKTRAIKTPKVYGFDQQGDQSYLALQVLNLHPPKASSWRKFGQQLARLHQNSATIFGAKINTFIGRTTQANQQTGDWFNFWKTQRLGAQLTLAKNNGARASLIDDGIELADNMHLLFSSPPKPACLHGDLWQGNWGFDPQGQPVIYDPAFYYGDCETDLAMTRLFGQAHPDFYAAYHDINPIKNGAQTRETFYNIYHLLNHYHLFGGGYADQAHDAILQVLSEIR